MSDPWEVLPLGDHVLAESPRWEPTRLRLSWVDIPTGMLCHTTRSDAGWGTLVRLHVGPLVTAVEPEAAGGWWVATGPGVALVSPDGRVERTVTVSPTFPAVRTNDMVRAPDGSLLVGLFAEDRTSPTGGVCRVNPATGEVTTVLDGLVTANGLGVSRHDHTDEQTLYAVDTARGTLTAYAYDVDTGEATAPRVIVREEGPGRLDGLVIGGHGDLWVAVWGLGQVRRYDAAGGLLQTLRLPVDRPTALALVDDLLVVTTARTDLTPPSPTTAVLDPSPEGRLYAYRLAS